MTDNQSVSLSVLQKAGLFLLFLACGLLVFVVFSHYSPVFHRTVDILGRIALGAVLLTASLLARRSERFRGYWLILFAFFTALAAISVDYYLGLSKWINPLLGLEDESPGGWAIDKLESSLLSIIIILLLNRAAGNDLKSLYIRRGRLWIGLLIGLVAFIVMIVTVIPLSTAFFNGVNLSWARILPWTPWVLIFILANASNEELLFRGQFFGKLEPYLGKFGTNLVTAIPFTLMHSGVSYTADALIFIAILLVLSLAWGYVLQKTDSIWGSILFHAAMDIPIFVGILSNL